MVYLPGILDGGEPVAEREFRVVIPKSDNANQRISVALLEQVIAEVADRFQGVTAYSVTGCFEPEPGALQCEDNVVIDVTRFQDADGNPATPALIREDTVWMRNFTERLGVLLGQGAIFEQQELDTRTAWVPGQRLDALPPDRLQRGPVPNTVFGRLLGR